MPSNRLGSRQSSMTRCGKCCYYCRQVATFLFSHIGLCTLLLGYALVGAFTFQVLESDNEHQLRKDVIKIRANMITELSNMTNHSQILMRENWTKDARLILEEFEKKFVNAVKIKGFDGSEELNNTSSQWTFSGALLYSIIVITTIGYGNVAPRTDMGKVVTILYAIIGIPLMLFCLSNIGHAMAHSFKFIYWKCCCFLCVKPKKVRRRERRRRRLIRQHRQRAMMQHSLGHSSSFNDHQYNQHQQMAALYGAASLPQSPITAPVTSKPETKEANGKESGNNHRSGLGRSFSVRSTHFRFPSFHHKENSNKESAKQTNLNNQSPTSAINTSATTTTAITTTTNSTTNSTTTTPENNSMQTTPLSGSDCSNCTPKFFPSQTAQSAPSASSHEYYSLDPAVQSTATTAITTPTTTITNFTTNSLVPKKSNLSRSHSARRYNETFPVYSSHYQQPHQLATFPNGDMIMARNLKDKASLHSIICNKYASLSDECIDASREFQEPTIHLRLPPKRVQSQVRFRPSQDTPNLNLVDETQADDVAQPPPFPFPDTTQGGKPESAQYIAETKIDQAHAHHQLPPPPFHQSYYHPNEPVFESESQLKQMSPLPYYQKQFLSKDELMDSSYAESENGDDDDDDDDDIADKNIPITVCLALVIGYICGGAWFFSNSEEWSFLDASYFCFITLSTIGFGDLVPGRTVLSTPEDGQMTLAICALYLLFGMALLAMMLNLVKEKAIETVRIVGQRIGILVSDEDNYY